jgi:hypothetical protein
LQILCAVSLLANVAVAEWNALNLSIGRVIRLIKQYSCSNILLMYFD